jgi:transcriptional regulator with GAF, ATPase, and Fis domain/predicted negative regulator of RcsB-dependent stress response
VKLPERYESVARLGKGGGGEVWAVRDRVTGASLALKMLAKGSGEAEDQALVREAVALSALSGLGLPRIEGFGTLPSGERYMVRELAVGRSLDEIFLDEEASWLGPIADAADQLTLIHRAGLFHGDIKPANVVVGPSGRTTFVDLGLARPFKRGQALGLTPKYAAPELLDGEPIGVRAEVYALGATLQEGLDERGHELDKAAFDALSRVAKRATLGEPEDRYPSVDELASAMRHAGGLGKRAFEGVLGWPILGLDAAFVSLESAVVSLAPGESLLLVGAKGSGRSTFLRRLAFSLGLRRVPVAVVEPPTTGLSAVDGLRLAIGDDTPDESLVVCVDDLDALPDDALRAIEGRLKRGARLVGTVAEGTTRDIAGRAPKRHDMPKLEPKAAAELARRTIVSLPESLVVHLVERAAGSPGALRTMLEKLGHETLVSTTDVDHALAPSTREIPDNQPIDAVLVEAQGLTDRGRFDAASALLDGALADTSDDKVRLATLRAKILLARGDADGARAELDRAEGLVTPETSRTFELVGARVSLRLGDLDRALLLTERPTSGRLEDAIASEALSVRGIALAYKGDDARARQTLESAVMVANLASDARALGIAKGSLGIAHQRAGRSKDARAAYEEALAAAESANDAWTVATMRLNLAGLAQAEGDLGRAIAHLEAATDLGAKAGGSLAARQAALNLANLDLYLGRLARAQTSLDALVAVEGELPRAARAQLLGLDADLAQKKGEIAVAHDKYVACATAYEGLGRPLDAAEAKLEALLIASKEPGADPRALLDEIDTTEQKMDPVAGFAEHAALASIVRASCLVVQGDEVAAKAALDSAYERAKKDARHEIGWRALEARGALALSQGSTATARRDTEAALAMLEEVAAKLPRDLREVFWNDPKRRALRAQVATTLSTAKEPEGQPKRLGKTTGLVRSAHLPESDRLTRIFEITRDLARERDLERLLERVVDHAVALVGAERGFLLLVDDGGKLVAQTVRGQTADDGHAKFSRSVADKVISEGEPVIATSARDDERLAQAVSVHQLMIQSIACVPVRGSAFTSPVIGALYLETRLQKGLRFREELPTLSAFADQAAIAIESARLIEENRQRANELALANDELERARIRLEEALGRRTEQLAATRRDLRQVRAELRSHFGYAGLVGTSAAMRKLYAILERVKDTDVPVLITGESGTGKEVVARAIHQASPRAKNAFIGVNCGAIPGNLLESELFGHVRGAFTGADRERKGLFREAEGGTILLDEIGEMPHKMQAGLLRVLQEKTVRPVGGVSEESVDVRVVAATHRELSQMVREGTFREDLYYRLHVVTVEIPPLRARLDDLPALVDHFLGIFAARHRRERKTVSRQAMKRLSAYDWPGNVRQLEHVLLNAWLMSESDDLGPDDFSLPTSQVEARPGTAAVRARTPGEFRSSEKERILEALGRAGWNRMQAAKLVGIPRRTFYRRLKEYGILVPEGEGHAEGDED